MASRGTDWLAVVTWAAMTAGCAAPESTTPTGMVDAASIGTDSGEEALEGALYEPGRRLVQKYCAGCHWKEGRDAKQEVAYPAFHVDTYEEWASSRTILLAVLDKWNPDGDVMPPPDAVELPDDDRRTLLDWIRRNSPNSLDGR